MPQLCVLTPGKDLVENRPAHILLSWASYLSDWGAGHEAACPSYRRNSRGAGRLGGLPRAKRSRGPETLGDLAWVTQRNTLVPGAWPVLPLPLLLMHS